MIEPRDLLSHAVMLVRSGSEADLRRAVSAAYYALFHSITASGAHALGPADPVVAAQIARAYEHGTMVKVCRSYLLPEMREAIAPQLVSIAQAFVELQDARHRADYDLAGTLTQTEAGLLVGRSAAALHVWPDIAGTGQGHAFLVKLLLGPRMARRG